jgi:hypothetical protein
LTAKELNSASSAGGGLRHDRDLLSMAVKLELEKLEAFCKQQQQMEMQMQRGSHADNLGGGGGEGAVVVALVMLVKSFMHSIMSWRG